MKLLEPPVLFDAKLRTWPASRFCSDDGRWEQILGCALCGKTQVRFLGAPLQLGPYEDFAGVRIAEHRLLFGCEVCGCVFTLAFRQDEAAVWLGCQWTRPLVDAEPEDEPRAHAAADEGAHEDDR